MSDERELPPLPCQNPQAPEEIQADYDGCWEAGWSPTEIRRVFALESIARSLEKLVEQGRAGPVPRSLEVATEEASAAFRGAMERRG